ncbi:GrpB family protein [Haliscomenobacter hydrossis]|uniref:GrpB family protein n=1 Tax=Haliscomenobacter hydrossis (strain ATCC 27775 / DSM 1100 / LMG 10767 / O) TaxID=760192 RepID=F4L6A7_HALH1|nr:GrpB family protein [Haliscomenobacter hydrossis]AEE48789.1 protein of unknown function UPF0157 [Haliscomenobacter hydrossis DSM 1100]
MSTLKKITISPYNPEWQQSFLQLKVVYTHALDELITDIQHVGSTSVIGLDAKPVLDIDIVIEHRDKLAPVVQKLAQLGYTHVGDRGIKDREAFKRNSDFTPTDGSQRTWPAHHLYVCPGDSVSLKNHVTFRDYLRNHPEKCAEYGTLKRKLAQENPHDINWYIEQKTAFIVECLQANGFAATELRDIEEQNKA